MVRIDGAVLNDEHVNPLLYITLPLLTANEEQAVAGAGNWWTAPWKSVARSE